MSVNVSTRIRARHRLSAVKVAKVKEPGLYEDGEGLRLIVTDTGTKRWVVRVTIAGRRVERGLGVWPTVSLEEARRDAEAFRKAAREGRDARVDQQQNTKRNAVRFRDAFDEFFAVRRQHLSNGKHVKQWETTMREYVFPIIGDRPVADITAAQIIEILKPIWFTKPETASRVLQRLKATFDGAILRGTRERANPCVGITRELGTSHQAPQHHAALPWKQIPAFVADLHGRRALAATRLALEFLVLTATRSGDVRGALWSEIDRAAMTWTIPGRDPSTGRRTKTGEPHSVPLSTRALAVLDEARQLHTGALVFPSARGKPLSDNTLSKLMRDAGIRGTPHGFRSGFKDWAAENGVRDEVSEAVLAHADANRVRAAYRRTRYLDERTVVMQRWSDFVSGGPIDAPSDP